MCRTVVMYTFVIFSVLYQARPRVMITAGTITNSSLTMIYSNFTTRIMHSYLISMIIGRDSPIFPDQYTLLKNNETSSICNYHYLTTHCRRQISSQHVLASRRGAGVLSQTLLFYHCCKFGMQRRAKLWVEVQYAMFD